MCRICIRTLVVLGTLGLVGCDAKLQHRAPTQITVSVDSDLGEALAQLEVQVLALAGCAEPPGGWFAPGNAIGTVVFLQSEVTPGRGARSTTKTLPSTSTENRTVCCDTSRSGPEWTPECQGCCERRVVFDWRATAPVACY